jgi:DNA-binding NtrC family response regulator
MVLSFATQQHAEGFSSELRTVGYSSQLWHGPNWLQADRGSAPPSPLICLIDGSCSGGRFAERLLYRLDRQPWLCAWQSSAPDPGGDLLRQSTEFMEAPWSQRELALRVERFCRATRHPATPGELPADFAKLNLIGSSPRFRRALRRIRQAASCTAPVLLQGETGTGKELAARAIHYLGSRHHKPFVPLNCGAIPEHLIENELFGHEKGAYTDAKVAQDGLAVQADGGTLFLDELETLSPRAQVALLRFLQDQEVRPLGGRRSHKVDVRIVAATNGDLERSVANGEFRADLYFRLNVVPLRLPPLRERETDIELLARHFLRKFAATYRLEDLAFDIPTLSWMRSYRWPGNVRELENYVHRAAVCAEDGRIRLADLVDCGEPAKHRPDDRAFPPAPMTFKEGKARAVEAFERSYLLSLLSETGGNVTLTAKRAGKERRALGKLLKKHGIDRASF